MFVIVGRRTDDERRNHTSIPVPVDSLELSTSEAAYYSDNSSSSISPLQAGLRLMKALEFHPRPLSHFGLSHSLAFYGSNPLKTYVPLNFGIAEVRQPIKYLTLGDPCPHCGYPPHEEITCPPPPIYSQPSPEDPVQEAASIHGETQHDPHNQTQVDYILPRCSPPLHRAYVHRQGVAPAHSAPTRTDYAITYGFPTEAPRHPPLDLNQQPPPTAMEVEIESHGDDLQDCEIDQTLGGQRSPSYNE
ncbi:hypothetical protein R1sor_014561 [Riccia sorocarpa]|uniref:NADH dehydrogenase subunit I n=1 Tax=Riccia sorocarpa TaxID=122646 RepID=A0ABD3HCA4_9MARC